MKKLTTATALAGVLSFYGVAASATPVRETIRVWNQTNETLSIPGANGTDAFQAPAAGDTTCIASSAGGPITLQPGQCGEWITISTGELDGTGGSINFPVGRDAENVHLDWNVPWSAGSDNQWGSIFWIGDFFANPSNNADVGAPTVTVLGAMPCPSGSFAIQTQDLARGPGGGAFDDFSATYALVELTACDPRPVVTSISPSFGPPGGGTFVTVTGTGFVETPSTGNTAVSFNLLTNVVCPSTTTCMGTLKANASGYQPLVATVNGVQSEVLSSGAGFVVLDPPKCEVSSVVCANPLESTLPVVTVTCGTPVNFYRLGGAELSIGATVSPPIQATTTPAGIVAVDPAYGFASTTLVSTTYPAGSCGEETAPPALTNMYLQTAPYQMTVELDQVAWTGGAVVKLTSSNPSIVSVPPSVTISDTNQDGYFDLYEIPGTQGGTVTITASYAGKSVSYTIAEGPLTASIRIQIDDGLVSPGETMPGAVVLENPAPANGARVQLVTSDSSAVVISNGGVVTIPAGLRYGTFTMTTPLASSAPSENVTITATYAGASATASVVAPELPACNAPKKGCGKKLYWDPSQCACVSLANF